MLDKKFSKFIKSLKPNDLKHVELYKSILKSRINQENTDNACPGLYQISANGWNAFEDLSGDNDTRPKHGYTYLIDYMSSKLPAHCIRLNEEVLNIDWSSNSNKMITVKTSQNAVYQARKVLCTLPLGCLKSNPHLFSPLLPENKRNAINALGFGCVAKIFVVFDRPVFKKDTEGLKLLWHDDSADQLQLDACKKWHINDVIFFI